MSRGALALCGGLILFAVSAALGEYLETRAAGAIRDALTDRINSGNFDPTAEIPGLARWNRYMDFARAGMAAGVLTTLIGVVILVRDRSRRKSNPAPVSAEEVQALRDEIAALKEELNAVRAGQS